MPDCGSQVVLCDLPIRFDTYKGCSHGCKYCFVQRKADINIVKGNETRKALELFIQGTRTQTTNWCDWDIPLHWGGLSDPFQPIEQEMGLSYECLKVLAQTKYPFVVSTKGALVASPRHLDLLSQCNAVVQISMVSSFYDRIEPGAPTFEQRLQIVRAVAPKVKRVIIRVQPYLTEVYDDLIQNLPRFKEAGAYGITIEGMKFIRKKSGLVKVGADFVYPIKLLQTHFEDIKDKSHASGLKFYCAENRWRTLGDDMACCGINGLDGFIPNTFNLCHLMNGDKVAGTQQMNAVGTAGCFKAIYQNAGSSQYLQKQSFQSMMLLEYKKKQAVYDKVFGLVSKNK